MLKPHYFQEEAVNSIFDYFYKNQGNPLIAMPTATGKSVVIALLLKRIFDIYPYQKIIIPTHVKELVGQNHKRLLQLWPQAPAGINSAGLNKRDYYTPITFCGIKSIAKNHHYFGKVDLILIDEAHLVGDKDASDYLTLINGLKKVNPCLKVIGFTATAWRQGMGLLTNGKIFTDICYDLTKPEKYRQLIAEGFLSPLIPKKTHNYLDVDGVHIQNGDFNLSELQKKIDKYEITRSALEEIVYYGQNRKSWLIFASGVEHSIHCAEILKNELNIECEAVHSKMENSRRDAIIKDYLSGNLQAVTNNNVLTTGFDHPQLDLIGSLRPTTSSSLWVQMLGRGGRCYYHPGHDLYYLEQRLLAIQKGGKQNCLVLDFARNTERLGPINDPYIPKKKSSSKGEAPVKPCPACGIYVHASVRRCEYCGYEFPEAVVKFQSTSSEHDLIKGDVPEIEEFKVDYISYNLHQKIGKPNMMKVSYFCNLRQFNEYVCPEHPEGSFAKLKAKKWWKQRFKDYVMPDTVEKFLEASAYYPEVKFIRVWLNKKEGHKTYPEIMSHCFNDNGFPKS